MGDRENLTYGNRLRSTHCREVLLVVYLFSERLDLCILLNLEQVDLLGESLHRGLQGSVLLLHCGCPLH